MQKALHEHFQCLTLITSVAHFFSLLRASSLTTQRMAEKLNTPQNGHPSIIPLHAQADDVASTLNCQGMVSDVDVDNKVTSVDLPGEAAPWTIPNGKMIIARYERSCLMFSIFYED